MKLLLLSFSENVLKLLLTESLKETVAVVHKLIHRVNILDNLLLEYEILIFDIDP